MRRVIGIDPGLAATGIGIIDITPAGVVLVTSCVISTSAGQPLALRLAEIFKDITKLLNIYKPTDAAYEHVVAGQGKGDGAALTVQASGAILTALGLAGLLPAKYPPQSWKAGVVPRMFGGGRAEKPAVQAAVRDLLRLTYVPSPSHVADGLGIAIHHGTRLESGHVA